MRRHKRIKKKSVICAKQTSKPDKDEYLSEMKQIDRKKRFSVELGALYEIASLNSSQRKVYAKANLWSQSEMAKVQREAIETLKSLSDIGNDKIAFMLTLTADKKHGNGFNLRDAIATWNRFLYFFSKGNYILEGWVFLETKKGQHPHVHIILYQSEGRTKLSTDDFIKPMMQFAFAINQCEKLNRDNCDITPVLSDPEYLVGSYLFKEAGEGVGKFDFMEPLYKGQIDGSRLIEKFGVIINEI